MPTRNDKSDFNEVQQGLSTLGFSDEERMVRPSYKCTDSCTYVRTCTQVYICTYICTGYMYMCTYIIYVQIFTYLHMCMCTDPCPVVTCVVLGDSVHYCQIRTSLPNKNTICSLLTFWTCHSQWWLFAEECTYMYVVCTVESSRNFELLFCTSVHSVYKHSTCT